MRFLPPFFLWAVLLWPLICVADNTDDLVEALSSGSVNWTSWSVTASGTSSPDDSPNKSANQNQLAISAYRKATDNVMKTIYEMRLNTFRNLSSIMREREDIAKKVAEMVEVAAVAGEEKHCGEDLCFTVEMSLVGGFFQLVLPKEIVQVEAIKAINGSAEKPHDPTTPETASTADGYSGLIVDARGIGARPALVPILVDENGKEVYSPVFVSREYAVQKGVCSYVRSVEGLSNSLRVAPNPLIVKGIRAMGRHKCNIMLSNADASKLLGASKNLHFLKQCRVIIVLD